MRNATWATVNIWIPAGTYRSWLAPQMYQLFETRLAVDWPTRMGYPDVWEKVAEIDDGELWETHQILKMRLINFVRRRLLRRARRLKDSPAADAVEQTLDPEILTIGCGRRIAAYKRGDLILAEHQRLAGLVSDPERPIQIIFAGKAHPRDEQG